MSKDIQTGLVVRGHGRHYVIEDSEGQRIHCLTRGKKSDCVVGDRVRWLRSSDHEGVIEKVEPRRNLLFRQDEWKTKSFAANLDRLLILVAVDPQFSESQLTRALIAARSAGITADIVLNKTDLPGADAARERLAPYKAMGQQWYWMDSAREAALLDSPGFQEFGLRQIAAPDLASYMPDFQPYLGECRFHNCSHRHEPGCAVLAAVEAGKISPSRYRIYDELWDELSAPPKY